MASELLDASAHPRDTHSPARAPIRRDPAPLIRHLEGHRLVHGVDPDGCRPAAGVVLDVVEALLHNAEDRRLYLAREPHEARRDIHREHDARPPAERVRVPAQRGCQADVIQERRVEQGRQIPQLPRAFVRQRQTLGQRLALLRAQRPGDPVEHRQVHRQGRNLLGRAVVELAGDPPLFLVSQVQEPPGKLVQGPLGLLAPGDVLDREQRHLGWRRASIRPAGVLAKPAGQELDDPALSRHREVDLEAVGTSPAREGLSQQLEEARVVELALSQIPERPAFGLSRHQTEHVVEGPRGSPHPEPLVQHDQPLVHGLDDGLSVLLRPLELLEAAQERIHVEQRKNGALDLVVDPVGPHPHGMPVPVVIRDRPLAGDGGLDDLPEQLLQIGQVDVGIDVGDPPAGVGGNQIEQLLRLGGEPAYS